MIYSPHTFELTLYLGYEKYDKYLRRAFKGAKANHRLIKDENDENIHYDEALKSHGVRIMYVWNNYRKRIILVVNPSKLLGGDDIPKLWKPSERNISEMLDELEEHIDGYFDSEVELNDFTLTRMDFTVNINLKNRKSVSDYIKVLHNLGKVKGFTPMKDVSWINKELAFVLRGNSNDIIFWAYDKEGREEMIDSPKSRIKAAKGILRIEIQLTTNRALLKFTDKSSTKKQIKNLAKQSEDIFLHNFERIMPRGDFHKKGKAEEFVGKEVTLTSAEQRKMLKLIEFIPKKKSLLLAQRELKSKDIKNIMRAFEGLDLCPVTISKRHGVKHLRSLYYHLD
jgi:hypothetical protein